MADGTLKLWTVIFHHGHGTSCYHVLCDSIPDDEELFKHVDEEFEPDKGEYTEVFQVFTQEYGIVLPSKIEGKMKVLE